jgi:hypothetical protein
MASSNGRGGHSATGLGVTATGLGVAAGGVARDSVGAISPHPATTNAAMRARVQFVRIALTTAERTSSFRSVSGGTRSAAVELALGIAAGCSDHRPPDPVPNFERTRHKDRRDGQGVTVGTQPPAMARRGMQLERQKAAAIQGGQRQIARGDRPTWRIVAAPGERWVVTGLEWLNLSARSRRAAMDEARVAIAGMLEVPPDAFDVI